jgi:hypothetical protein
MSLVSLDNQTRLQERNATILKRLDDHKSEITKEIETLMGDIERQSTFLSKALDERASAVCYRELQALAKGAFNAERVRRAEDRLNEAESFAANLSAEDQAIVSRLVQVIFNIIDEVEGLRGSDDAVAARRQAVWATHARDFGKDMQALRERSPFHQSVAS